MEKTRGHREGLRELKVWKAGVPKQLFDEVVAVVLRPVAVEKVAPEVLELAVAAWVLEREPNTKQQGADSKLEPAAKAANRKTESRNWHRCSRNPLLLQLLFQRSSFASWPFWAEFRSCSTCAGMPFCPCRNGCRGRCRFRRRRRVVPKNQQVETVEESVEQEKQLVRSSCEAERGCKWASWRLA